MTAKRWRLACMRLVLVSLVLSAAPAVLAADPAPPLMRPPSKVAFVSTGMDFPPSAGSFGMDETGAIYGLQAPGQVFNYLSCWPKGAKTTELGKYLFDFEQKNNLPAVPPYWLGMTFDNSHALFARRIDGFLTLGKVRCDDVKAPVTIELNFTDEPLLTTFVMPLAEQGRRLASTPDGAPCFPFGDVLRCYGPDKKVVRSFAIADAIPHLQVNPEWRLSMFSKPPPKYTDVTPPVESWHIDAFVFVPDGRLFALIELKIERQVPGALPGIVRWLVEQAPDGKIRARSRATLQGNVCGEGTYLTSPLNTVRELHYDSEHKAILAWPVGSWDLKNNQQQATSKQDDGSPALGMRVFPVDGDLESGYLSLTDTYGDWFSRQYRGPSVYARPNGGMLIEMGVLPKVDNNSIGTGRLFDIKVDAGALDLDLDGLTATEETALGTSPWLPDSDGGGNSDREEVIAGTKPLDANDDEVRAQDLHRTAYSISTLLRWRVGNGTTPPPATDPWGSQRIGGARLEPQPFCLNGVCRGRSGEVVATWPVKEGWGGQPQSSDASMVLLQDGPQYMALHVPEGITQPLASVVDVEQLLEPGAQGQTLFAVGRHEVYVSRASGRRIVVIGDGPPRLVFDLDAVRCASGLGCSKDGGFNPSRYTAAWFGYDGKLKRLLVAVKEKDNNLGRAWIVGVHATLPPVLLSNLYELADTSRVDFAHLFSDCSWGGIAVPTWATDTGRGDLLTDFGRRGPYLQQLPSDLDMFADPVRRVWNDTLVQMAQGALYEVVQIPEKVEPGELLVYSYDNHMAGSDHGTLWHIPARGGKAEVFQLPKVAVSGMNVAPDGRVCLAAPEPGVFMQVRAHPLTFGMPSQLLTELRVGKVVDCDYGPDGRPHLLMTDPPRVLVWNGKDDAKNPDNFMKDFEVRPLNEAKTPFQLLVDKDGKDTVLYDNGPVLGMGKLQDGSIVEVRTEANVVPETQRLHIHGKAVGPDLSTWINKLHLHYPGQMQFMMAPISWKGLRVHVAQRPDGLIAVLPYLPVGGEYVDAQTSPPSTVLAWDPRSGQTGEFTPLFGIGMHLPHALTVLPGGTARDPWTGGPVVLPAGTPNVGEDGGPGSDGSGTPATGTAKAQDGGCAGQRHTPGQWQGAGLVLLALTLLRRRRVAALQP